MNETINLLWHSLQERSRAIEMNMNPLERKRTGSYYTSVSLTDIMMHELVSKIIIGDKPIEQYRFLEPCVGTGNFVFSYLNELKKLNIDEVTAYQVIKNIYVADINEAAINGYTASLKDLVYTYWGIKLDKAYFDTHVGAGLLVDVRSEKLKYTSLWDVFDKKIIGGGFDIVVTNPPYKNLKAERSQYINDSEYELDKNKYESIPKLLSNKFRCCMDGVLNLYKLFVEEIIDKYTNKDAYVSLLVPASILSDKTCTKLRTHILRDMNLISVKIINEGNKFIDAKQALSAVLIHKGEKTQTVKITKDYCKLPEKTVSVDIKDIADENTGNAIFAINEIEYRELKKLRKFPVVRDLKFISNLRGELDLTANKRFITCNNTGYKLLRGRNIDYYKLSEKYEFEFVEEKFVKSTKKSSYIMLDRIACQQVVNMHKKRRITFAFAPKNYVLGNSCNFISVSENDCGIDIYNILGLFNTKIIDWFFKLTSSNNHVNNYEIDCFPVPVNCKYLKEISEVVQNYLKTKDNRLIDRIENLARKAYGLDLKIEEENKPSKDVVITYLNDMSSFVGGLTYEKAERILKGEIPIGEHVNELTKFEMNVVEGITVKYKGIYNGWLLNHTTSKLSDLDLEMIKAIPPGGNWKDIPKETVSKSKRLKRIAETGGRTTLYGRIDYKKPSYTITTYFNRPGNGTYVHPVHQRVLSVREAARFQTFKDDYYFFGNKTQLLKQVGNAVPTIFAYQIARKIKEKTNCSTSIDLFCGAGGMTAGFKAAGIKCLLSNDIEESACITLKINNPEISVLCGDITQEETKSAIYQVTKEQEVDIICGGPPCQGFSLAGFRSEQDPRNQLFREFVDIVKRVNPKVIVFENVEGILSYQGGKTYREVHALFAELGYQTEGRSLMASDFAVPQRRKRVIIICTRRDLNIRPAELFPVPITVGKSQQVTAEETILDLEDVECGEKAKYTSSYNSEILRFFKGSLSYEDYIDAKIRNLEHQDVGFIVGADGQLSLKNIV